MTPPIASTCCSCCSTTSPRPGGARGGDQVARAFTAHPVVTSRRFGRIFNPVWKIGQLVEHGFRREGGHGVLERGRIEDVADDGLGAERAESRALACGAGHAGDDVSLLAEQRQEPYPDYSGRAG